MKSSVWIARAARSCAALALGLTLVPAAPARSATATPVPMKFVMDWAFEGAQAIWTAADASGCYTKAGLDLKIDRGFGSGDAISKVASGAYDVGVADFASLVAFNAAHPDNKLEAIFIVSDRTPTSVTVLKSSGITKPKDLEGKRIADNEGEASRVLFPAFAKKNGIDISKITWVTVAPNLRQAALAQGQADAVAGHLFTVQMGLESLGVDHSKTFSMAYADYGLNIPGSSIVVRPQWAEAHRDALKSFVACAPVGIKSSIDDPKAAVETLHKFNSLSDPKTDSESLAFSTNFAILTPYVKKNGLSQVDNVRLDDALGVIAQSLGVPKPAVSEIWNGSFVPNKSTLKVALK
jgi:NitT/TauT family transport system substrate-binding protein